MSEKSLAEYCEQNNLEYILDEWHSTKNGDLKSTNFTYGSNKKVWWMCKKGHEWESKISNRAVLKRNCPYCTNRKILVGYNDLATTYPDLTKEWHPTKNGDLKPTNFTYGSNKKVWWMCKKGHEWESKISNRAVLKSNCPYCTNRKVLVGYNDLATTHPDLAKEWHPTKNGDLKPTDIIYGSTKKVWWKCSKGHEWVAVIESRVRGNGCAECVSEKHTSFSELVLYYYLKQIFPNVLSRTKINSSEIDIYIPDLKLGIEYDGYYWHKDKEKEDLKKNLLLEKQIYLIRVREEGLNEIKSEKCINTFVKINDINSLKQSLILIFKIILDYTYLNNSIKNSIKNLDINIEKDRVEIYNLIDYMEKSNSLATKFPEIAKEWNYNKNKTLSPKNLSYASNKKVWWICEKGHEWEATVGNRTITNNKCPYCSNKKVLIEYNDLATTYPDLAKEWHHTKNGDLKPTDVTYGSNKKIWWMCEKGHEWEAKVYNRTINNIKCPYCEGKRAISGETDLMTLYPDLAKEWHPTKNKPLLPSNVLPGSGKRVWWMCKNGREWQSRIVDRVKTKKYSFCSEK